MDPKIIKKPKVDVAKELRDKALTQSEEMGQVVIHFIYTNVYPEPTKIRIWPSTFLYDNHSDHISELIHVENITMYPVWQDVEPLSQYSFTLIFTGLPKSCTSFDFEEVCDGDGGEFALKNIQRNTMDVYWVEVA